MQTGTGQLRSHIVGGGNDGRGVWKGGVTCDPDVPAGRQAGETQSDFPNGETNVSVRLKSLS